MATRESLHLPVLGEHGDPCARCATPLADDQRYCLECGLRRAQARVAFMDVLAPEQAAGGAGIPPAVGAAAAAAATPGPRSAATGGQVITPGLAAAGIGLAVLFLAVGVLVGRSGDDNSSTGTAPAPQVVTVGGVAAGTTPASATEFTSDWPDGEDGFTVQLQALPKDGTDAAAVAAAKTAATGKGAAQVGALDSDDHSSLDGGKYIVYSGVFKTKSQATAALKKLKQDFPGAKVVKVAAGGAAGGKDGDAVVKEDAESKQAQQQLQDLEKLSGADYSKQAAKLPDKIGIPGKAPPKDNKKPGGGSDSETIE